MNLAPTLKNGEAMESVGLCRVEFSKKRDGDFRESGEGERRKKINTYKI